MFCKAEIGFCQLRTSIFLILLTMMINYGQSKQYFARVSLSVDTEDLNENGKSELKIKRDTPDEVPRTNEETLAMVMIGVGILLFFVCCGVCCKHCWCPRGVSRGLAYRQMGSGQRPPPAPTNNTTLPTVHNMVPLRHQHQGFTEMQSRAPPPYSSLSVRSKN